MHGYDRAKKILTDHRDVLSNLAEALLEHESLGVDQIDRIMRGEKLDPRPAEAKEGEPAAVEPEDSVPSSAKAATETA